MFSKMSRPSKPARSALVLLCIAGALCTASCDDSTPPELMPLQDQEVRVNETAEIRMRVRRAEGNEQWSFHCPTIPDLDRHASLTPGPGAAVFRWAPLISHLGIHLITFTVSRGSHSDSQTVELSVLAPGSAPRFLQPPPGGVFDLSRTPCIDVMVAVLDDDSVEVDIRDVPPLVDGGSMSTLGGHEALWSWCPSESQVDASARYTLHIEAQDERHPPVPQSFDIVLLTETSPDCPGAPPTISAITPTSDSRVETIRDYVITASVEDDLGLKDVPLLFYSTENPSDPEQPDLTEMYALTFAPTEGNRFEAAIPNLALEPGQEQDIYFIVSATDDDDPEGTACDHSTLSVLHRLTVASPAEADLLGYCMTCTNDSQCESSFCVAADESFCAVDCGEGSSCDEGHCEAVTSRDGLAGPMCVPAAQSCAVTPACVDDELEDNDTLETASPLSCGTEVAATICAGDDDWWRVTVSAAATLHVELDGGADAGDLDLKVADAEGTILARSMSLDADEDIDLVIETSGDYFIQVHGFGTAEGPFTLHCAITES